VNDMSSVNAEVRDHCDFKGSIVELHIYSKCNLHFKKPKFIPVIFYNLANYDSHLFIKI